MNIKEMVSDNKKAHFLYFNGRTQEFWYKTETGFSFPVPLSEIGEAILNTEEKALLLMRYIRKHIALIKEAQTETQPQVVEAVTTAKQCDQEVCNCGGLACAPDDEATS